MNWDIDNELGFKIIKTAKLIEKQLNESLEEIGLTIAQGKIILQLDKEEVINQKVLSDLLNVEPATIVRTLDRMERDGFIKRIKNPNDRRVHFINLTNKAKSLVPSLKMVIKESLLKSVNMIDGTNQTIIKEKLDLIKSTLFPDDLLYL